MSCVLTKTEIYRFRGNREKCFNEINFGYTNKIIKYGYKNCKNISVVNDDLVSFGELNHQLDVTIKAWTMGWFYKISSSNKYFNKSYFQMGKRVNIPYIFRKCPNKTFLEAWSKYFNFEELSKETLNRYEKNKTFFVNFRWFPVFERGNIYIDDINFKTGYLEKIWKKRYKNKRVLNFKKSIINSAKNYLYNIDKNYLKKPFIFVSINGPKKSHHKYHQHRYIKNTESYNKTFNMLSKKFNLFSTSRQIDKKILKNKNVTMFYDCPDFLAAYFYSKCAFLITISSGPNYVAYVLKKKVVWTNMIPFFPKINEKDAAIYKKLKKNNKFLNQRQMKKYTLTYSYYKFKKDKIKVIDNSETEIYEVVKNFLKN